MKKTINPESMDEQGLSSEEQAQLAGAPTGQEAQAMEDRSSAEMLLAAGDNDVVGDTGGAKPRLPRLNIVQKVGPLGDKFTKGHIILNQEDDLIDATKDALTVTVAKALFFFEEIVPYGEDRIPGRASTAAEVYDRGGELKWGTDPETGKSIRPTWQQVAEVLFVVKAPEGFEDSPSFPFRYEEEEDKDNGSYTFAMMKIKGASFTSAGQEILTAKQFYFRDGLQTGAFSMTAPLQQFRTGNSAYVLTLRKSHNHSEKFQAWLKDYQP